jgi:hypothetical protein
MGNWRTVNIIGSVNKDEAIEMRKILSENVFDNDDFDWSKPDPVACVRFVKSLAGLNEWVKESGDINTIGNLSERDYDNDDIYAALVFLAEKFSSLKLTLHSGSDWEDLTCSATFEVKNGAVKKFSPKIERLQEISSDMMIGRMFQFMK